MIVYVPQNLLIKKQIEECKIHGKSNIITFTLSHLLNLNEKNTKHDDLYKLDNKKISIQVEINYLHDRST